MNTPAHLAHLDRDPRGRPVPYINVWGDPDAPDAWSVQWDPHVQQRSAFMADDRAAGPNFFKQSIQRQRKVTRVGLCQVCARPVDWHDRRLVISAEISTRVEDTEGPARGALAVTEPWLCPDCAEYATRVCPGLLRRERADDLVVTAGFTPQNCRLTLTTGWIEGRLARITKRRPVAMWIKIVLLDAKIEAVA